MSDSLAAVEEKRNNVNTTFHCQTSSHLHINTIVFNVNIQHCNDSGKTLVARNNEDACLVHFHHNFSHFLIWKWKCDIEDWKLKWTARPQVKSNYGVWTQVKAWNSSFLPKQNKTTLCDRWLRVSENTLLLELTPCVFWLFRETLDFLLAIYSWFFLGCLDFSAISIL